MWRKFGSVLLFFLSGCMVGPNYHSPYIEIPETFHYQKEDAYNSLNIRWWELFKDPILNDLVLVALAYNKDIKIAAANIENALGVLIQIRAPLFPQIGYDGQYSRMRNSISLAMPALNFPTDGSSGSSGSTTPPFSISNPQTAWQAVFSGSWEIDLWGRIRRQLEAARANLYATYQVRQGVILSIAAAIASNYIQLRSLDEQLEISIRTKNSYAETVEYFTKQFKYGQTSEMTVVQAQTQYQIAAANIPQLKAQIVQIENSMSVLLGSNPRHIPRGKSIRELVLPDVPAGLPSNLLSQRPDIMQAEGELIAANAQIGAAKALYFPSISLTGFYGNASSQLKNLFTGPANTWSFTGSITGPIFTAGAIYGQVVQAEAQRDAALLNYELTIQQAFAEVESALNSYTELQEQLKAEGLLVEAAGKYVSLGTLQYKGGYAPYFIVIQAQQQYFPSELSWVQTRRDLLGSLINIYQAMGGGWVHEAEAIANHAVCE